uniref:hypothetical protein n=1 Tax=Algoriphagus sp. TaxID=1872435 RepID=UPI00404866C9
MDRIFYNYLYLIDGQFCSSVCEVGGRIVGHNAIIPRKYLFLNENIIIGLSSGGMVDPLYSGVFLKLLSYCVSVFKGQGIIAFPNKKSEPFFSKILKFNSIINNYFTITKAQLNNKFDANFTPKIIYHPDSIESRIKAHVRNNYLRLDYRDTFIIFKNFHNGADIIFVSSFNRDLIHLLNSLFESGYQELNLIFNESKIPLEIGFISKTNNSFVYKWLDAKFDSVEFNCQMIDSDVF